MNCTSSALVLGLLCAVPAFAAVTVTSPAANSKVSPTFTLNATAGPCSSQPIASMGYSLDSSSNTTIRSGASISASVSASLGSHVLHVKSWGNKGASCTANVNINVASPVVAPATNLAVAAPVVGASVASPFTLTATGSLCQSQKIAAMGYSLDNSTSTTIVDAQLVNAHVAAGAGAHTLHVKAWGNKGASCVSNVALTVIAPPTVPPPSPTGPSIPSTANVIRSIQQLSIWKAEYDVATGSGSASATGITSLTTAPSLSGQARAFDTTYTNYGGERYHVSLGPDQVSSNFVYDTELYIDSSSTGIANIEMDLNQVLSNGQTVIMGFQCDGWVGTWDYTINSGTPTNPVDHWMHSNQSCDPQKWSTNAWHHVQVQFSRDNSGNVTYQSVWLDGVEQDLNVTVPSAFALGWAPTVLTNFQIDGMTAGTSGSTIYMDKMTVYSW